MGWGVISGRCGGLRLLVLVVAGALAACGDAPVPGPRSEATRGDGGASPEGCPPGTYLEGDACLDAGLPTTGCPPGSYEAGEGCVEAGLLAALCPPGSFRTEAGECLRAGVSPEGCGDGQLANDDGTCPPPRVALDCTGATRAELGEEDCRPLGACVDEPPPDDVGGRPLLFVDATAAATGADGSPAHPFPDLPEAIDAAPADAFVFLRPGAYAPAVLERTVTILGACAEEVTIAAAGDATSLRVVGAGVTATIEGVALTGGATGLEVEADAAAILRGTLVHDLAGPGIVATDATLELVDVAVAATVDAGIALTRTDAILVGVEIRDVAEADRFDGCGIVARREVTDRETRSGTLAAARLVVHRVFGAGLELDTADVTLNRVFVGDVAYSATPTRATPLPAGIAGRTGSVASLSLTNAYVHGALHGVAFVDLEELHVEDTEIRGDPGALEAFDLFDGVGVFATVTGDATLQSVAVTDSILSAHVRSGGGDVTYRGLAIRGAEGMRAAGLYAAIGVFSHGGTTTVDGCAITDMPGDGLFADGDTHIESTAVRRLGPARPGTAFTLVGGQSVVRGCLVEDAPGSGIWSQSNDVLVEASVFRRTGGNSSSGIPAAFRNTEAHATLRGVVIEDATSLGVFATGGTLRLEGSVVRGVASESDSVGGIGVLLDRHSFNPAPPFVELVATRIEGAERAGIFVTAEGEVQARAVVVETSASGFGVDTSVVTEARLAFAASEIHGAFGLSARGGEVNLRGVRFTPADAAGAGRAISLASVARASLTGIVVDGHDEGILCDRTDATGEGLQLEAPDSPRDTSFGIALLRHPSAGAGDPAEDHLGRTRIERSEIRGFRSGVMLFGADAALADVALRCNEFAIVTETLDELAAHVTDEGGNVCGCGRETPCVAQSLGLGSPSPL